MCTDLMQNVQLQCSENSYGAEGTIRVYCKFSVQSAQLQCVVYSYSAEFTVKVQSVQLQFRMYS